jgi:hypothetical protein
MTVDALFGQLVSLDVILSVEDGQLVCDAPAAVLTPELRASVTAYRGELIRRLSLGAQEPDKPDHSATSTVEARDEGPSASPISHCPTHIERRQWIDAPPINGRILTTCQLCGGFIGYRPAYRAAETSEPGEQVEQVEQVELFEGSGNETAW